LRNPSHSRPLLLDTGPLLTALALIYYRDVKQEPVPNDIRPNKRPLSEEDGERVLEFLGRAPRRLTTPHVLTEVFKLRDRSELRRRGEDFRGSSLDALKKLNIEERHCPLSELASESNFVDCMCRHGLTDAALLCVSVRENCTVLTDDKRLFEFAGRKVQLLLLDELLEPHDN
jgi:predicted nucleic acid-binding protein